MSRSPHLHDFDGKNLPKKVSTSHANMAKNLSGPSTRRRYSKLPILLLGLSLERSEENNLPERASRDFLSFSRTGSLRASMKSTMYSGEAFRLSRLSRASRATELSSSCTPSRGSGAKWAELVLLRLNPMDTSIPRTCRPQREKWPAPLGRDAGEDVTARVDHSTQAQPSAMPFSPQPTVTFRSMVSSFAATASATAWATSSGSAPCISESLRTASTRAGTWAASWVQ